MEVAVGVWVEVAGGSVWVPWLVLLGVGLGIVGGIGIGAAVLVLCWGCLAVVCVLGTLLIGAAVSVY